MKIEVKTLYWLFLSARVTYWRLVDIKILQFIMLGVVGVVVYRLERKLPFCLTVVYPSYLPIVYFSLSSRIITWSTGLVSISSVPCVSSAVTGWTVFVYTCGVTKTWNHLCATCVGRNTHRKRLWRLIFAITPGTWLGSVHSVTKHLLLSKWKTRATQCIVQCFIINPIEGVLVVCISQL